MSSASTLFTLAFSTALSACGAGTARVVSDTTGAAGPVAVAPTPAPTPPRDSAPTPPPSPSPAPSPADTANRGYAPYGAGSPLDVGRIGQWTYSRINESRRLVIRDANAWASLWKELSSGDPPAIDFARDAIIAAAAGQQPSGGHEIRIDRVTRNGDDLTIHVVETIPGPSCTTTQAMTQPVDIVGVPAAGARSWSFVEQRETRVCRS